MRIRTITALRILLVIVLLLMGMENQKGSTTCEYMELDARMKVTRMVANYSSENKAAVERG